MASPASDTATPRRRTGKDTRGRDVTHAPGNRVVRAGRAADPESRRHPDGLRVPAAPLLAPRDGRSSEHFLVRAWDE